MCVMYKQTRNRMLGRTERKRATYLELRHVVTTFSATFDVHTQFPAGYLPFRRQWMFSRQCQLTNASIRSMHPPSVTEMLSVWQTAHKPFKYGGWPSLKTHVFEISFSTPSGTSFEKQNEENDGSHLTCVSHLLSLLATFESMANQFFEDNGGMQHCWL